MTFFPNFVQDRPPAGPARSRGQVLVWDAQRSRRPVSAARWDIGPQSRSGVWLPGGSGARMEGEGGHDHPPSHSLRGLRVLLVDDSPETLEAFRTLLEIEGAVVRVATGGRSALDLTDSEDFDLILSDIGMPGMDGYELIAELRRRPRTSEVAAFALSGFSDRAGIQRALDEGFHAYIDKPVTLDDLLHAMAGAAVDVRARRET